MKFFVGLRNGLAISAIMWMIICTVALAADVTIKGLPDGISEAQVKEWVGILVERIENAKINQIPEVKTATDTAKTSIDSFRKANALTPKFETVESKASISE